MMRIDIATLFPEMCNGVIHESIVGRGIKNGFIEIYSHNIRDYTLDKHRRVDEKPYGGGTGMLMQAQPVYDCVSAIKAMGQGTPRIIYMSPQGETLTQGKVRELAAEPWLILLCGHYEGIDSRALEALHCEELSIGDYVLTGGELPALVVADAVARLQSGVLPNEDAYSIESHYNGLLEYPQYTRPEEWHGMSVPQVLLTGDHRMVSDWQKKASLKVTESKRPELHRAYIERAVFELWQGFVSEKGLPSDTKYKEILRLGADERQAEMLMKAVLRGKKRTAIIPACDLRAALQTEDYIVVSDWYEMPRCVVKVIGLKELRLCKITEGLAEEDSVGQPLAEWKKEHERLFSERAQGGGCEISEDMLMISVNFRLEYKGHREKT